MAFPTRLDRRPRGRFEAREKKNFHPGVDGRGLVAIMRRSLRERCPSADPQAKENYSRGLALSPARDVYLTVCAGFGQQRSLTIQSDNLCGCLRLELRWQTERKYLSSILVI